MRQKLLTLLSAVLFITATTQAQVTDAESSLRDVTTEVIISCFLFSTHRKNTILTIII